MSPLTHDNTYFIRLLLETRVKTIFISTIILLLLLPLSSSSAATRYVSDQLEIPMRKGQGIKFGIRKMLTSGEPLTILQTNKDYSQVKTKDGVTGWVLTRYLSEEASARDQLDISQKRVTELESSLTKSQREISGLTSLNTDTDTENESLQQTAQRLKQELGELRLTASNAISLANENSQLKVKIQDIDHQLQAVTIENNALKGNDRKRWFLSGAAVLLGGIFLGLILPRLRVQRKTGYGSSF